MPQMSLNCKLTQQQANSPLRGQTHQAHQQNAGTWCYATQSAKQTHPGGCYAKRTRVLHLPHTRGATQSKQRGLPRHIITYMAGIRRTSLHYSRSRSEKRELFSKRLSTCRNESFNFETHPRKHAKQTHPAHKQGPTSAKAGSRKCTRCYAKHAP
jgi:hypothetical protein